MSYYGYCPICMAPGKTRERRVNGNDTCENGHTYPSKHSREEPVSEGNRGEVKFCPTCEGLRMTSCVACGCGNCLTCGYRWTCMVYPVDPVQIRFGLIFVNKQEVLDLKTTDDYINFVEDLKKRCKDT